MPILEHADYEYVGVDAGVYPSTVADAPLLADAHSLPFLDQTFDLILSVATLQYSPFPFQFISEVSRVLRTGGVFLGTVAFMEPYHETYFHHTHLGLRSCLVAARLQVDQIGATPRWSGAVAMATMGLFPGLPRLLANWLVSPLLLMHRGWWGAGKVLTGAQGNMRGARMAGSFSFVARKLTD